MAAWVMPWIFSVVEPLANTFKNLFGLPSSPAEQGANGYGDLTSGGRPPSALVSRSGQVGVRKQDI